jgi:hypothetical protein
MPDVQLETDEVDLVIGGEVHRQPCEVILRTDPRPRLTFRVSGMNPLVTVRAGFGAESRFSIHIVNADVVCEVFFSACNGDVVEFSPYIEPVTVGGSGSLACVHFDLINFPGFHVLYGPAVSSESDRLDVTASGWCVGIRPPRHSVDVDAFRSSLYSVTHSCTMRRSDGATFSSGEARDMLITLCDALSFAAGRWVAPVFVAGSENDEKVVWKQWGSGRILPDVSTGGTWFDPHHAGSLTEILSGLLDLRKSPERAEAFNVALYWYVRSGANAAGVDGGLILLQAALERLCWQRFVTGRRALSRGGFGKLPAEDHIRLLIEDCRIPTSIPPDLMALQSEAKARNWMDGPQALAAARNLLVHPEKLQPLPWAELWKLATWYLELVLLNTLGFAGQYSNRTLARRFVGAVERVPWA